MKKKARFCRVCGAKMAEMTVRIRPIFDPYTGERGPNLETRWDCPEGTYAAMMGYPETAHSSPDLELL